MSGIVLDFSVTFVTTPRLDFRAIVLDFFFADALMVRVFDFFWRRSPYLIFALTFSGFSPVSIAIFLDESV